MTLLALGSASPEIVLNSVSAVEHAVSLSLNAVLGSAMIAFGLIPALCSWASPHNVVHLRAGPIIREVCFYCIALFWFIYSMHDGNATTMEALSLVSIYVGRS